MGNVIPYTILQEMEMLLNGIWDRIFFLVNRIPFTIDKPESKCYILIDKPDAKSQSKVQASNPQKSNPKKGKGNLASGLSLKSFGERKWEEHRVDHLFQVEHYQRHF